MKVIVCGGRDYWDSHRLERVMDTLDQTLSLVDGKEAFTTVITGGAPGADLLAKRWAEARGKEVVTCHALWKELGKKAGPMRNQFMVDVGADLVVVFPGGRGTADLVRRAEKAGIPVKKVQ